MIERLKARILTMIDREIEEVEDSIGNTEVWKLGSTSVEESEMFDDNIADFEAYREMLLGLRAKVKEGMI